MNEVTKLNIFNQKEMSAQEKQTMKQKRRKFVTNNPYKKLK